MRMRNLTALGLILLLASWCGAALAEGGGQATFAVQGVSEDGDGLHFAENSGGQQSGVALESLAWRSADGQRRFDLRAYYGTGESGWLDLVAQNARWTFKLRSTVQTQWTDTSFAMDRLPSGTPIEALFPGSADLDSSFGIAEPSNRLTRLDASLTRRFSGTDWVRIELRLSQHDGEKVPSFGGYSFSDVGTLSAYSAALGRFDSDSTELAVRAGFELAAVDFQAGAGIVSRSTGLAFQAPLWSTSSLLGWNDWYDNNDVDTTWLSAAGRWDGGALAVFGSAYWADTTGKPTAADRLLDPGRALDEEGLRVRRGQIDQSVWSGALGASWSPLDTLLVTLSVDTRDDQRDGTLPIELMGSPFASGFADRDESRVGVTALARLRAGKGLLRVRLRQQSQSLDAREERDSFLQVTERDRDVTKASLRYSVPLSSLRLALWGRYDKQETTVNVNELFDGYVVGDHTFKDTAFGATLAHHGQRVHASLDLSASSTDIDSSIPSFDPIFDPSLDYFPVSGEKKQSRVSGTLLWTGDRGEVWGEAGLLSIEYTFPGTGVTSAFVPLSEDVSGTVLALGTRWSAWSGGEVMGRLERVDDGSDLDATLTRGVLEVSQELREKLSVFARWSLWDYTNSDASLDDYTYQLLAAGARVSW